MGNEGINRLARVLDGRTKEYGSSGPPTLDFGTVRDDMSLLTDKFPEPIPQADYVVCRSVTWGAPDAVFTETQNTGKGNSGEHAHGENGEHPHGSSGEHGGHVSGDGSHGHPESEGAHDHPAAGNEMKHVHDVLVGSKARWIRPGDRVLVAWVGDDACVIDIIYPATVIG